MSAQEFKVGQSISGTDYDRLPVGAKFRRGPQYSEYEVTETGFKLGMADTRLTAADYRSARKITYLPATVEPEDKDDLYVEPEHVTEPSVDNSEDLTEPEDADDVAPEPLKEGDWVLVWAKVEDEQYINTESNVLLSVVDADDAPGNVWARYDAIVRPSAGQVPPWVKPARCTSLKATGRTTLHRCEGEEGHGGDHVVGWVAWTDAEAYGRVEAS